jgi:hypothetical protein
VNTQSRKWIAFTAAVVAATLAACLIPAGKAGDAMAPRLVGRYPTSVRDVADTSNPLPPVRVGYTSVRTWRFLRHCSQATCATTLLRPSIIPGRRTVFRYSLHVVSGTTYKGKLNVPDYCLEPSKTLPLGSVVDRATVTIRPTRTSAGRAVAYGGTMVIRVVPTRWARAEGCTAGGYQRFSLRSPE